VLGRDAGLIGRAMGWLLHVLGVDQGQPYGSWNAYNFWSGAGSDLAYLGIFAALYRKHNCHQPRCWRIGRHVIDGTPWCNRHHQDARKAATPQ
jgi:hypothetical protein